MTHSVIITTPIPTLDELGKELGLTKARQKFLIRLVEEKISSRPASARRKRKAVSSKAHKIADKNGTRPARKKNDRAFEASA